MKTAFRLFALTFIFCGVLYPQDSKVLDEMFYNTWLRAEYYNDIINGKTPAQSMAMEPLMQLHFYKDENLVLAGSFNEGIRYPYEAAAPDTILIIKDKSGSKADMKAFLARETGEVLLKVLKDGSEYTFKNLGGKYNHPEGVWRFVNDKIITGKYALTDGSSHIVEFTTDGKVYGLDNFTEYGIPLFTVEPPHGINVIGLRYAHGSGLRTVMFHWKKVEDGITLYKFNKTPESDEDYINGAFYKDAEVEGIYAELKKL